MDPECHGNLARESCDEPRHPRTASTSADARLHARVMHGRFWLREMEFPCAKELGDGRRGRRHLS